MTRFRPHAPEIRYGDLVALARQPGQERVVGRVVHRQDYAGSHPETYTIVLTSPAANGTPVVDALAEHLMVLPRRVGLD